MVVSVKEGREGARVIVFWADITHDWCGGLTARDRLRSYQFDSPETGKAKGSVLALPGYPDCFSDKCRQIRVHFLHREMRLIR